MSELNPEYFPEKWEPMNTCRDPRKMTRMDTPIILVRILIKKHSMK